MYLSLTSSLHPELKIGFNPINYSVIEGNTTVDITVVVIEGSLGRNVEIAFNTVDILGQATGKCPLPSRHVVGVVGWLMCVYC